MKLADSSLHILTAIFSACSLRSKSQPVRGQALHDMHTHQQFCNEAALERLMQIFRCGLFLHSSRTRYDGLAWLQTTKKMILSRMQVCFPLKLHSTRFWSTVCEALSLHFSLHDGTKNDAGSVGLTSKPVKFVQQSAHAVILVREEKLQSS